MKYALFNQILGLLDGLITLAVSNWLHLLSDLLEFYTEPLVIFFKFIVVV
ncbi:MAG: hypothetical protein GF329_01495 [Candidatus Lokiarchaeota archaeon]|nr:hypothetical protein [Candidatus Lokiarchaeota archaeon]